MVSRSELEKKIADIDAQVREIEADVIGRISGLSANAARGHTDVAEANIGRLLKAKRALIQLWDDAE